VSVNAVLEHCDVYTRDYENQYSINACRLAALALIKTHNKPVVDHVVNLFSRKHVTQMQGDNVL